MTLMTEDPDRPSCAVETIRGDLKLLDRLLGDVLDRAADDVVVCVNAVDRYVSAASELTGG